VNNANLRFVPSGNTPKLNKFISIQYDIDPIMEIIDYNRFGIKYKLLFYDLYKYKLK